MATKKREKWFQIAQKTGEIVEKKVKKKLGFLQKCQQKQMEKKNQWIWVPSGGCEDLYQTNIPQVSRENSTEQDIDEIDQIFGLRLGAWDYLTKPISTALLVEKVAAVLKRVNRARRGLDTVLTDGGLIVDPDRAQVSYFGEPVSLTVTELAILEALMRAEGAILTYDQLAERTRQTVVTNNTLSTHIKHIRRKLKAIDNSFDALINVYGTGYRWESPPG